MEWHIIIGTILIVAIVLHLYRKNKYKKYLLINSQVLIKLAKINDKYKFNKNISDYFKKHIYDNEKFYNSISCADYLIYDLQFNSKEIQQKINEVNNNKSLYIKYKDELPLVSEFGNFINQNEKQNKKYLLKLEKIIYNENLQKPKTEFMIHINLYCQKMNGKIYKSKKQIFTSQEILSFINRLNNKNNGFYNDRNHDHRNGKNKQGTGCTENVDQSFDASVDPVAQRYFTNIDHCHSAHILNVWFGWNDTIIVR